MSTQVIQAGSTVTVKVIDDDIVGVPTFVQATQPDHPGPYAWWDTSGGNLTLWIEDGVE